LNVGIENVYPKPLSRSFLVLSTLIFGCVEKANDSGMSVDPDTDADTVTYDFASRFNDGESSVDYAGQTLRQVLITEMKSHIGGLTARIDDGWYPAPGDVSDEILFYIEFDSEVGGDVALNTTPDNATQTTFNTIASGQNLLAKVAGNDTVTDHKDWSTDFVGWDDPTTPEALIRMWVDQIDQAAVARSQGEALTDAVYLSADGVDRQQLLQKFLTGAITFSQGVDDYLDDDIDGKGLLSDNTEAAGAGKPYSDLEHAWDEGFGYFGANQSYGLMTPAEIHAEGGQDINGDSMLDLTSEVVFGTARNAAKRDVDAVAQTQFVTDAWTGFHQGRTLIAEADSGLNSQQMDTLRGLRGLAVSAWEAAIAATVIHCINEIIVDVSAYDTEAYSLNDVAKHWSEAKGFALSFQFNPNSPLIADDFVDLHLALGRAPVLAEAGDTATTAWVNDLIDARNLLGIAFGFNMANLGDDNGENGW
jgi:hypothetical protein